MAGTITALWTAIRAHLETWAYTRIVASLPKRLTSLAIVLALFGSPAVLSACMTICLPRVATAASHPACHWIRHAGHSTAAVPAGAAAHAHHASPVSESAATGPATASSHDSAEGRPSAPCTNCCPEAQAMLAAGSGVERIDANSLSATPIASRMASFLVTLPRLAASPPSPPMPPPSPTRGLLVLRI